jgi:N6-adenosine-specific RNA methylase IME4
MGRVIKQLPRSGRYGTIIADPPWPLRGGKGGRQGYSKTMSADVQYDLMSFREINAMGQSVQDAALANSHLYMWVVSMYLQQGLDAMRAWGFRNVTNLCWYMDDETVGLGQYFRTKHQLVLFGVRGKVPYATETEVFALGRREKRVTVDSAFAAARLGHSQKPPNLHDIARRVSPGPRLEMFARERVKGWDAWGNQL